MGKKSKSKQVPKEWMSALLNLSATHPRSFPLSLHSGYRPKEPAPSQFLWMTTTDPAVTAARNLAVTVALVEDDAMTECTQTALERTDPEPPGKQAKQRISKPSKKVLEMNDAPSGSKSKKK
ncbi:hypothetical protein JB92DRAFT_2832200 [Gautieria morchelliformis]|nr:hypothetical protein JB92DRAFT_2832200 [Gautieria morchelliformis]